jgi:hypothetical protein
LTLFQEIDHSGDRYDFAREGLSLYRSIKRVFVLKGSKRHSSDPEFFQLLQNIRRKEVTEADVEYLKSRQTDHFEIVFESAPLICPRNKTILDFNEYKLSLLQRHVYSFQPKIFPKQSYYKPSQPSVNLSLGCKVTITQNLSVKHGLANGTHGILVGIVQDKGPLSSQLDSVCLVSVPNIQVPGVERGAVPICPIVENIGLTENGERAKEKFLPLTLGYSFSVHKTQGRSMPIANFYFDKKEYFKGQTYTQLSRVSDGSSFMVVDKTIKLERFTDSKFTRGLSEEHSEAVRLGVFEELFL